MCVFEIVKNNANAFFALRVLFLVTNIRKFNLMTIGEKWAKSRKNPFL